MVRGLVFGLASGLIVGLIVGLVFGWLALGLVAGLFVGLVFGLIGGIAFGLVEPRSVLITSRTPTEARLRSLIAALGWLVFGLAGVALAGGLVMGFVGLVFVLVSWFYDNSLGYQRPLTRVLVEWVSLGLVEWLIMGLIVGLVFGLVAGLVGGLNNGGWFVLLQKVAHHRLARAGSLPPRPDDFLEWGIEQQIFRRVGGGVRFRHNLIQQHLVSTSADAGE